MMSRKYRAIGFILFVFLLIYAFIASSGYRDTLAIEYTREYTDAGSLNENSGK